MNAKKYRIIEQGKILWLINRIQRKFTIFMELAFDLTHKTEFIMNMLWSKIAKAIAHDRIKDPEAFIDTYYNMIYPIDVQVETSIEHVSKL